MTALDDLGKAQRKELGKAPRVGHGTSIVTKTSENVPQNIGKLKTSKAVGGKTDGKTMDS